jgi:hypothetical protein
MSKDLYAFYQKAKSRDDDIKDIRAQLLSMGEKSVLVREVLRRDGAKPEDESSIEHNLQNCNGAVAELRGTVERLKTVTQSGQGPWPRGSSLGLSLLDAERPGRSKKRRSSLLQDILGLATVRWTLPPLCCT